MLIGCSRVRRTRARSVGWLVVILVAAFTIVASPAAAQSQPIEGTWTLQRGQVVVQQQPDGSFAGVVVQPVNFAGCTHPVGQTIWTINGSGFSYTGSHVWFKAPCQPNPGGQSTWKITSTAPTTYTLVFCTAHPGSGPPDPAATPSHPVGSTLCYALTRTLAPGQIPVPANTTPPTISGAPKAGQTLSCSAGTWTNSPTGFVYQWARDGTPIVGATSPMYTVRTSDEQLTLTCTVTAYNLAGAGTPATSSGVAIQVPYVRGCPRATGRLRGNSLGLARLGMTRAQARRAYRYSSNRGKHFEDFFCLTPTGVRVGYASPALLAGLSKGERHQLRGRVVWASTSSAYYSVGGIRAGATVAAAAKALRTGKPFHIGRNDWYLAANGSDTAVLKVRKGIVEEIGIADKRFTRGRKAQRTFLKSFY